jgi:hypothetical protein
MLNDDIHDSLRKIYERFDVLCKEYSCFYDIVSDESDRQGYLLKDKDKADEILAKIKEVADANNVHIATDKNRKDGVLFTFTLQAIKDGHWKLLSKHPKRHEYSTFASDKDAKRVRAGKTMYQRKWPKKLAEQLDAIFEGDHIPTVAIDLDGTLATDNTGDQIGAPRPGAKKAMQELQQLGCRIIIFTVRGNRQQVRDWCHKHEIPYDYVNHNPDQPKDGSNKVIADLYVDDRAINGKKSWSELLKDIREKMNLGEDQLKYPSGRYRRAQSQWRSSFHKSRTFGGVTEAIAGAMIPPHLEKSGNVGLVSAQRSNSSGEKKIMKPYNKRKDATDLPTIPPKIYERTVPGTRLGRTNDPSKRSLTTNIVPSATEEGSPDGPEDVLGANRPVSPAEPSAALVIPSDTASIQAADPLAARAREQNMRPLGVFGPRDMRQPSGGPVSNVQIQHPPDRSFDASTPKISVNKQLKQRRIGRVYEHLERPEDGYELLQLISARLGLTVGPRKITKLGETYVKVCDGDLTIEFHEPRFVIAYRNNKKILEREYNLQDQFVVDRILAEIL